MSPRMMFDLVRVTDSAHVNVVEEIITVKPNYIDEGSDHELAWKTRFSPMNDVSSQYSPAVMYQSFDELLAYFDAYTQIISKKSDQYYWHVRIDGFPAWFVPVKKTTKEYFQDQIVAMMNVFAEAAFTLRLKMHD